MKSVAPRRHIIVQATSHDVISGLASSPRGIAPVDVPQPISSFISRLFSPSSQTPRVSPLIDYPGLPTCPNDTYKLSSVANVSRLSNGVLVASLFDSNSPPTLATFGVYVDVGTRDEQKAGQESGGISRLSALLANATTATATKAAIERQLAIFGSSISSKAGRESTSYTVSTLAQNAPAAFNYIADAVLRPSFLGVDVHTALEQYESELEHINQFPAYQLSEAIHEAAYGYSGLGRGERGSASEIASLSPSSLQNWFTSNYQPRRFVVAAVGLPHEQLVSIAEAKFGEVADNSSVSKREKTKYVAGDIRKHETGATQTHLAIAFPAASWSEKELLSFFILQSLLGGSGKSALSRLSKSLLKSEHISFASSFNHVYSDAGLFGVAATSSSSRAADLSRAIIAELRSLKTSIDAAEFQRAKAQLRSSIATLSECDTFKLNDVATQLLATGRFVSTADVVNQLTKVTAEDVRQSAIKLLSAPPSVAALGDLSAVPRYDAIAAAFKQ